MHTPLSFLQFIHRVRTAVTRVQEKRESTRKRLLWALSSASMLLVILFWALYLNATVTYPGAIAGQEEKAAPGPGVVATFEAGAQVVGRMLAASLAEAKEIAGRFIKSAARNITVEKAKPRFILKNLPPLTPSTLP